MKTIAITAVALAALLAGCGGHVSPAGVASVDTSTTTTPTQTQSSLLAFSQCMRANGVTNFPDPQNYAGGNPKLTIHELATTSRVRTALNACGHLLPSGPGQSQETEQEIRTRVADALSFAKCMRSHGIARFPDPTATGDLSVAMVESQGIDVHSPAVLRVVQTCIPASHGGLTLAKVKEAIANH
jgi:hypothetical protein